MSESIAFELQLAAVILADQLSYPRAAEKLNITPSALRTQISELESLLELRIFRLNRKQLEVTDEGRIFVGACRTFLIHIGRLPS